MYEPLYLRARATDLGMAFSQETKQLISFSKFKVRIEDPKRPKGMPRKWLLRKDRFFGFSYNEEFRRVQATLRTLPEKELTLGREIIIAFSDGKPIGWGWVSVFDIAQNKAQQAANVHDQKRTLAKIEVARTMEEDPGGW